MNTKIEQYLNRGLERPGAIIPSNFIEFWSMNYGQQVNVEIMSKNGSKWTVDRFLHLDGRDEITDRTSSWRGGDLEQLDYSVGYLESAMPNWEDHPEIFPFAGINTKHNAEYNLVTLDYTCTLNPRISIWVHEKSFGYEEPYLLEVSPNVDHFIDYWKALLTDSN